MRPTVAVKSGMPIEFDFRPIEQTGNVDLAVRKGAIYTLGNWPSTMPGPNRRHTLAECPTTAVPLHIGQASLTDCSCARRWQTVPVRITPDQAAALQRLDDANMAAAQKHPEWFVTRQPAQLSGSKSGTTWLGFAGARWPISSRALRCAWFWTTTGCGSRTTSLGAIWAYVFSDGVESYYDPATCEVGVGGGPPGDCRW
eukprot:m.370319 g.370319  ORF g.370319 m.370319 type:complete len:199 (+) comp16680_c1_seq56:1872-2468(+)